MNTKATTAAAALALGLMTFGCGGAAPAGGGSQTATSAVSTTPPNTADAVKAGAIPTPEIEAQTKAIAALGPHSQATYPPIPTNGYAPPRPPEVVTAAFQFAAEHPEISSYVPCFCGCQQGGHKGNHDCFVRSRAANGDVLEWEPHGLECAVCIDVATRSRQLLASGASVTEIRAAIEREFLPNAPTMTPTPNPPAAGAAHSH
ncbi:MAG: PCYCGC motif-containing (lipo)protein [Vicinamibacterales bacterium]